MRPSKLQKMRFIKLLISGAFVVCEQCTQHYRDAQKLDWINSSRRTIAEWKPTAPHPTPHPTATSALTPYSLSSFLVLLPLPHASPSALSSSPCTHHSEDFVQAQVTCLEVSSHFLVLSTLISPLGAFAHVTTSSFSLSALIFFLTASFQLFCQFSCLFFKSKCRLRPLSWSPFFCISFLDVYKKHFGRFFFFFFFKLHISRPQKFWFIWPLVCVFWENKIPQVILNTSYSEP